MHDYQAFTNCMHGYDRARKRHYTCTVLIPQCKNNLNMPMCSSFFSTLCLVAFSSRSLCCHACYFVPLCWFFCLFLQKVILYSHKSKGWLSIHFPLQLRKISLSRSTGFVYKLYQHDFRIIQTHVFLYQRIFHWKVETGLKHDFIMYNFLYGP